MKISISIFACVAALATAGAVITTTTVAAGTGSIIDVPSGCQANLLTSRGYTSGFNQGKALVASAWQSVNNCDRLEDFSDIVYNDVTLFTLTGKTAPVICRHTGLIDGVLDGLDMQWTICGGQCCNEGTRIGELSAELYCQLSIILGGLGEPGQFIRRPVYMCGFAFEACCDAEFMSVTDQYAGPDLFGQLQTCQPYCAAPFDLVCNETDQIQCNYVPPPS